MTRRYWKCQQCPLGGYFLDDDLGIQRGFSKTLQKQICFLSADGSFERAKEYLDQLLGVTVSSETIRSIAQSHGQAMAKFQVRDTASQEAFRDAPGEVEVTVDATKVNTRESGWRDLKILVFLKRERAAATALDAWQEHRLPEPTATMAYARIARAETFGKSWNAWRKALGIRACAEIHFLADGATWIWKLADRCLTGCMQTLDIFHASQHVAETAKAIFGEGTAEASVAFERGRHLLVESGWKGLCQWVADVLKVGESGEQERRLEQTSKLMDYFSKHIDRLHYAEHLAKGQAIGSGAVEGQAKTLGLRLKSRGARWNLKKTRPMAALINFRHNAQQWHSYWTTAV